MDQYPSHFPTQGPGLGSGMPGTMPGTMRPGMGSPGNQAPDLGSAVKGKKGKKEKAPTTRTAKQYRIGFLVALLAGGVAWYLTAGQAEPTTYVVTTNASVGALQQVTPNQLEAVAIDPEFVEDGAITADTAEEALAEASETLTGPTLYPLANGQQLRVDYFSKNPAVLTENLEPNERLLSVTASVASSVAGGIRPGDAVDIIAVDETNRTGRLIASNVPVVAVNPAADQLEQVAASQTGENKDANPSDLLPGTPIPGVYTIRVDADQVVGLSTADSSAKLYLAYRAPDAQDASNTEAVNLGGLLGDSFTE